MTTEEYLEHILSQGRSSLPNYKKVVIDFPYLEKKRRTIRATIQSIFQMFKLHHR